MATDAKTGQPIFHGSYGVGFNNVGSYQSSARPWAKSEITVPPSGAGSTALEISFPKVTKFITIRNDGAAASSSCVMRVGFATGGLGDVTNNYFTITDSSSFSADFRVTRLYIMSDANNGIDASNGEMKATIIAGLTQINASHLTSSWETFPGVSDPA